MVLKRALGILEKLVGFESISTVSNVEISDYVRGILGRMALRTEWQSYRDGEGVEKANVAGTSGRGSGGLVYCAHTDVVPVERWEVPGAGPFSLSQRGDRFFGRGSCDMKGSLACFLAALESIPLSELTAPVSVICTADEEIGFQGAMTVAAHSEIFQQLKEQQPVTVIGEPTSLQVVHAHKGIFVFYVTSHGVAAHSGTSAGVNANLKMIPFLQEMWAIYQETINDPEWRDERFHPAEISWNIGINDFNLATNITPERSVCTVSFRPMPNQDPWRLIHRAKDCAERLGLEFDLHHGVLPVYVDPQAEHIEQMLELTGTHRALTVSYGTDAAVLQDLKKIVICGPGNIAQAHTADEWIEVRQLERGIDVYQRMIRRFCCQGGN